MNKYEILISDFNKDKTLASLSKIKNSGLNVLVLENNKWVRLHTWKEGFVDYHDAICLYNDRFEVYAMGLYKGLGK